jgi:hypothetical protein
VIDLWGDPKTGLPVRIDLTMAMFADMKMTLSGFVFNAAIDDSLFSLAPPAGYTVQNVTVDASPVQEKDLIETFRQCGQLTGGVLPDSLDTREIQWNCVTNLANGEGTRPNDQETQRKMDTLVRLRRGPKFAFLLPAEADAYYAGKGVRLGAADKPIFWYRPNGGDCPDFRGHRGEAVVGENGTVPLDAHSARIETAPKVAKKYRVIYADLSVREVVMPPSVPGAQRLANSPSALNEH